MSEKGWRWGAVQDSSEKTRFAVSGGVVEGPGVFAFTQIMKNQTMTYFSALETLVAKLYSTYVVGANVTS